MEQEEARKAFSDNFENLVGQMRDMATNTCNPSIIQRESHCGLLTGSLAPCCLRDLASLIGHHPQALHTKVVF